MTDIRPAAGLTEREVIRRHAASAERLRIEGTQAAVDAFADAHGPCCAGCDHWRFLNSAVGEPGAVSRHGGSEARVVESILVTPMTAQSISRVTGIKLPAVHYGIRRASSGGLIEPAGFEAKQRLTSGNTPILWRATPRPRREGA